MRHDMRQLILLRIYAGKDTVWTEARAAKCRKMKKKSLVHVPPDINKLSFILCFTTTTAGALLR